jgi:hypothetical protein
MEMGEVEPANSAGSSVSQPIGEIQQNIFLLRICRSMEMKIKNDLQNLLTILLCRA